MKLRTALAWLVWLTIFGFGRQALGSWLGIY
jgi:hypothetical protein